MMADNFNSPKNDDVKNTADGNSRIAQMHFNNAEPLLSNPDRGLRMETYITLGQPLQSYPLNDENPFERAESLFRKYQADQPTLCQVYVYLSKYIDKELDGLALNQLENFFELFRDNGIRILLRFTYSNESVDDAPYRIVKRHIEQLKEWFAEKESLINDTLYCLQTGIIGYWGEGHTYHNLKKRHIRKVIADVCALAPKGIYTQVRTYKMLRLVSDANLHKVGIHDDYIVGDMNHEWTFVQTKKARKFKKTVSHAAATINDGEMPWGSEIVNVFGALDEKAVLRQLSVFSMNSLSLEHNYCENGNRHDLAEWKENYLGLDEVNKLGITVNPNLFKDENGKSIRLSVYDILRYHLGYQLALSDYIEENGRVSFTVTNYGFAAPLNFHYFALVSRSHATDKLLETEITEYDPSILQSGKSITYTVSIPDDCTAVGVKLDTFAGRNICVRFANAAQYRDGIQYFR